MEGWEGRYGEWVWFGDLLTQCRCTVLDVLLDITSCHCLKIWKTTIKSVEIK